jgi:hypothetical protein
MRKIVVALAAGAIGVGVLVPSAGATPGPTPDEGLTGACNMTNTHMRRLLLLLSVIALAVIALPSTAGAQGADVYGGGSVDLGTGTKIIKFAFSGHTGPQGDFGSYRWTIEEDPNFPALDVSGDVDCVNVNPFLTGAGGWIGGPVKKVTPSPNAYGVDPGEDTVLGINDFGNPSGPMPDEFSPYTEVFSGICKLLGPFNQTPISQGNINIKLG